MTTTNWSWDKYSFAPSPIRAGQKRNAEFLFMESARRGGHRLPRVSLIEADGAYYVQDGHHRVSVANALGDSDIEANVTAWV